MSNAASGRQVTAARAFAACGGVVLVAEGWVFATGAHTATDVLLLVGVVLVTLAFGIVHTLQWDGLGRLGKLAASAVILGGIGQIVAIAAGLMFKPLTWLHGAGFVVSGLGLITYGVLVLRAGVFSRAVAVAFIVLPVLPLLVAELARAAVAVEGTTIVTGLLWIGIAIMLPRSAD